MDKLKFISYVPCCVCNLISFPLIIIYNCFPFGRPIVANPSQPFLQSFTALAKVAFITHWNYRSSSRSIRKNMVKMDILSTTTPKQVLSTIGTLAAVSAPFTIIIEQTIFLAIRAYECQIAQPSSR
jgi:hypothetical protein